MKIRKGIIIFCYVALAVVCLWVLHRIGLSGHPGPGPAETAERTEYEQDFDKIIEPVWENAPDWEQIFETMDRLCWYIRCKRQVERIIWSARLHRGQEALSQACRERPVVREEQAEPEEEPYVPPRIMIASDLHYMSASTHDNGAAFQKMVAGDDGKVSQYSDIILDTLVQEALEERPSALVLAGDNTLNGERENHQALADKLQRLVDAGIPVLIVSGNHDIQNHSAATYFGDKQEEAEYLEDADDFLEIFHGFGYDQALSRDETSLSYVYALDDTHWMMMLDSCQYEDGNRVNGRIRPGTLAWMREQLSQAREEGISVVPVAHHNLLSESRLYTTECTMENHNEVVALLEEFEIPVYFSGHLHAQRIKKHKAEPGTEPDAYGVTEIVVSPFSIPPCQYGSLAWDEDGGMVFETRAADVSAVYRNVYAALTDTDRAFLDNFSANGEAFVKEIRQKQVEDTLYSAPDDLKEQMARLYANLYYDYCAGNQMGWMEVKTTKAYKLWLRLYPDSSYMAEMRRMVKDVEERLHDWSWEPSGHTQEDSAPIGEFVDSLDSIEK